MEKQSWEKEWAIKRAIPSNEAFLAALTLRRRLDEIK